MSYAESTKVPIEKTQADIHKLVKSQGANRYGLMEDEETGEVTIGFMIEGRQIRFRIQTAALSAFMKTPERGLQRSRAQALQAQAQDTRSRWRSLFLAVKAKFDSIDRGIETFDQAFMAHVVLPDGKTIAEAIGPQITAMVDTGEAPRLLLT